MAKKIRKPPGGRRARPEPDEPDGGYVPIGDSVKALERLETEEEEEAEEEAVVVAPPPRPSGTGLSPLVRSQEIELEIGLTLLGIMVGALTGYGQNVPMDATTGNLLGGIEGGAVGGMMGYSLGRTLFFSVRQQWISWFALVALAIAGHFVGGLPGAVAGAGVGTALVYMGVFGSEDDDLVPSERPSAG